MFNKISLEVSKHYQVRVGFGLASDVCCLLSVASWRVSARLDQAGTGGGRSVVRSVCCGMTSNMIISTLQYYLVTAGDIQTYSKCHEFNLPRVSNRYGMQPW